ncbi:ABC transporter permease [Chelatococcus asaccharovorans]|uniref:Putative hydroxymethylpyrimidine transport system permease protein n=1 Tax=Chelatococcus asaccharovorans TaxID=28210 RepID=A0A2V3UEG5_9HYPH|nr:putative hydroxymethylpyrimidine transport system permease protein [Chelatococcus asaccharovorans]CAH1670048.1 putative ABC transporter permease protein HI_0355 [Chelatococcus asaccharovorans]CAH1678520.1 putative ABC transporter permease protein HI_0355 [Chelatococcus asaccharovorans]
MRVALTPLRIAATLVIAWQALVSIARPPAYILPPPLDVAAVFLRQPSFLLTNGLVTLTEILAGFGLGAALGIATALAIAALPRLGRLVWPLVLVLQAFPVFVLAPVLVLWFGFGLASKVVMTTIIIFFPVASAFADGLRRTDPDLLDATALTTATHWQTLIHVRLPLALPALASGLKVAAPLAPLGAVVGEWVGASAGLGFVMVQANARMQTETMFAAMLVLAALTLAMRAAVDGITPYLTPWSNDT